MKKLNYVEWHSMTHDDRTALRRKAFGHPAPLPPRLEGQFDLEHLRAQLVAENEATGWFPGQWTAEVEEETEE